MRSSAGAPSSDVASGRPPRSTRLLEALLAAAACAVFVPSLDLFFWPPDDPFHLDFARRSSWVEIFVSRRPELGPLSFYRAGAHAVMKAGVEAFGLEPAAVRLPVLLAHGGAVYLFSRFAGALGIPLALRAALAAVFAVHPATSTTLLWVSYFTTPGAMLFAIGTILTHVDWLRTGRRSSYVASLGLFAAGLSFKEAIYPVAAAIPFLPWIAGEAGESRARRRDSTSDARVRGDGSASGLRALLAPARLAAAAPFAAAVLAHFFLLEGFPANGLAGPGLGARTTQTVAFGDSLARALFVVPGSPVGAGYGLLGILVGGGLVLGGARERALSIWLLASLVIALPSRPWHGSAYALLPPALLLAGRLVATTSGGGFGRRLVARSPLALAGVATVLLAGVAAVLLAGTLREIERWRRLDPTARSVHDGVAALAERHPEPGATLALVRDSYVYAPWETVYFGREDQAKIPCLYAPRLGSHRFFRDRRAEFVTEMEAAGREVHELTIDGFRRLRPDDPDDPRVEWTPEFEFARGAVVVPTQDEAWRLASAPDFDPRRPVLEIGAGAAPPATAPGEVVGAERIPRGWRVRVRVEGAALLVWNTPVIPYADPFMDRIFQPYGSGCLRLYLGEFRATAEDRDLPLYRANFFFHAVAVPEGTDLVTLREPGG